MKISAERYVIVALFCLLQLKGLASGPHFEAKTGVISGGYNFWVYTPDDYTDAGRKAPLILFLHGASLCGNSMQRVLRYGVMDALKKGMDIPAIIITPQNPGGAWNAQKLAKVLDWTEDNYDVDTNRVYVLGMSLGGYGAMDFCATFPERVAAAMALCGGCSLKEFQGLGRVPLWIMHGTADHAVSIRQSQQVVKGLQNAGNDHLLRYDWLKGASHGFLARLFYMKKTYDWLFSHSLNDKPRSVDRTFEITSDDIRQTYNDLRKIPKMYEED